MKHPKLRALFKIAIIAVVALTIMGCKSRSRRETPAVALPPSRPDRPIVSTVLVTNQPAVVDPDTDYEPSGSGYVGETSPRTNVNRNAAERTVDALPPVNVEDLISAFESTDAISQQRVSSAIQAIRARNYDAAVVPLRAILQSSRITPDQADAVRGVLAQIEGLPRE